MEEVYKDFKVLLAIINNRKNTEKHVEPINQTIELFGNKHKRFNEVITYTLQGYLRALHSSMNSYE